MTVLNFAAETVFEANTASGNVSLTRAQLQSLVDGNYTTGGVYLSGDNILALDVDLGNRIATKDLRYYFDSTVSTAAVASGISFYYRDYTTDPWSSLTTTYGAGYYTTTSGNFFPHQVRMIHTISGTSISGTLREYEVNSNEDIVDYGEDGTLTEKGLTDTPFGTSDPYTIPVYNDGDKSATAYVYIGNTGTDADEMLRISDAQNGTYIGVDDGVTVGSDNDEFSFNLGSFDHTEVDNDVLKLEVPSVGYIGETMIADPYRAVTVPGNSLGEAVIYYGKDYTFRRKNLDTGLDEALPASTGSIDYNSKLVYAPDFNRIYLIYPVTATAIGVRYFDLDTDTWSVYVAEWDHGKSWSNNQWVYGCAYVPAGKWADDSNELPSITIWGVTGNSDEALAWTDLGRLTISGTGEPGDHYTETVQDPRANGLVTRSDNNSNSPERACMSAYYYPDGGNQGQIYYMPANYGYLFYISIFDVASVTWSYISYSATVKTSDMESDRLHVRNWQTCFVYDDKIYSGNCYTTTGDDYIYWLDMTTNTWSRTSWFSGAWDGSNERVAIDGIIYGDAAYIIYVGGENEDIRIFAITELPSYFSEGTYTTPILKNQDPTYWYIDDETPGNTNVTTSTGTVAPTIEIRSSNTAPDAEDSHNITLFQANPSDSNYIYPFGFDYDGTELWRDTSLGAATVWYWTDIMSGFCVAANTFYPTGDTSYDVNSIFIWVIRRASDQNKVRVQIFNRDGGLTYGRWLVNEGYDSDYRSPTNAVINSQGNTYVLWRGFSDYDDRISLLSDTGYWNNNVDFGGDQNTLYSLCLAGEEGTDVWFIKEDENIVYRYSPNLTEVTKIENASFQNLNGVCEDGAGGVWIGDYGGGSTWIHHYDKDGTFIATYDVTDHVAVVHRIAQDYQGGVWLLDTWNDQIARFASNGTLIGKVALLNPRGLNSNPLGAYCMTATYDDTYFIDMDVNLNKTVSYAGNIYLTTNGSNWGGAMAASADVSGYLDTDDISSSDPVWGTGGDLEWNEVSKDTNFVHHQLYHQARITLRGDGTDTPEVEKIALPPTVQLTNIPVQGYKDAYLKTVVTSGTVRSRQSGKLRTWFSLEE